MASCGAATKTPARQSHLWNDMADARRAQLKDQTDISGARALIVEARFYDDIQDALMEGAVAELKAANEAWLTDYMARA